MKIIKNFALALCLALLEINTAQAVVPAGTQLSASVTLQGGSSSALKWAAPLTAPYKVHVFVPSTGNKTNALYRVYPKGKALNSTTCVSTDLTYPCYEVIVDQTQHKNAWTQLTLNGDVTTQWNFVKAKGYVTAVASNLSTTQMLNLSALVRFEKVVTTPPLTIGQTYQGGFIFYLDSTGQHGLISASENISLPGYLQQFDWHVKDVTAVGTSTAIGTGQTNTTKIVNAQGAGVYAAKICDDLVLNGYSDWYLPSKAELIGIKQNFNYNTNSIIDEMRYSISPFTEYGYWTSTYDANNYTPANSVLFSILFGQEYLDFANELYYVRPIRNFKVAK